MQIGKFEESEMSLIQQHLSQASVFVDVGANIGFYACIALMVGKRVIAIEPQPQNLKYLYENLHVNGWQDVEVYPVGLSSKPGVLDLYGASTTGASLIPGWAGATQRVRRVIPVSTLDILLGERFAGEKLFIKIDVEGVEYDVLLGASRTIKLSPRPTWMIETCLSEFHPDGLNPNFAATFEAFWRHGYEVRTADQRNVLIEPADVKRWINARHCDSGTINYIFR
jgi:FkbM family methyltransferase